MGSKVAIL